MTLAPYAKAITAALVAGLTALATALADQEGVSSAEAVSVALAVVVALGAVYRVPNKDPDATHQADSVQPPERDL